MAIGWPTLAQGTNIGYLHTSPNGDTWRWNGSSWDIRRLISSGFYAGPWVIFDTSYSPNYFPNLKSALTSAVSGDTIYLVTSVSEFLTSPIILKDKVNINLNGNTYNCTCSSADAWLGSEIVFSADSITFKITDGFIKIVSASNTFVGIEALGARSDVNLTQLKIELSTTKSVGFFQGSLDGGHFVNTCPSVNEGAGVVFYSSLSLSAIKVRSVKNVIGESANYYGIFINGNN